jgi:Luciferase-like monooxygenase
MKVGIFLTCRHPPGSDMVAALEGQYAMTRLARDRGWDAVATGQHYLSEGVRQVQLVPFLARLAAEAGEMTGIAGVLLTTLRNPVEVAECIASLDAIWRGNFVFGVGLGYRDVEFDAFGVPRGQRVRRFEQCLEVVKRLWTEDNVSFENDICKLTNVTMTCRPIQSPYPPIWFAANNDRAVQRAARLGDSWFVNPHATIPEITRQLGLYRAELTRLGKPFPRGIALCARDLLRQGPGYGPRNGRTLSCGEVPDLCQLGTGRGITGQRFVLATVRRAAARQVRHRQSRGMLRATASVLGRRRRKLSDFPHALERHAARPCTGQHAPDQRRAIACAAPDHAARCLIRCGGKKTRARTSRLSRGGASGGEVGSSKPVWPENRAAP